MSGIAELSLRLGFAVSGCDLTPVRHRSTPAGVARRAKSAQGHHPAHSEARRRHRRGGDFLGGEIFQSRSCARARHEDSGDRARRDARRVAADGAPRRGGRRHSWQDHHDLAGRTHPGGSRISIRPWRLAAICARAAPTCGLGAATTWWPRPTRATPPSCCCSRRSRSSPISIRSISIITARWIGCARPISDFINRVPFYGVAVLGIDSVNVRGLLASVRKPVLTYGVAHDAELRAEKYRDRRSLDALRRDSQGRATGRGRRCRRRGVHVALNSLAAIGVALEVGIEFEVRGARAGQVRRYQPALRDQGRGRRTHRARRLRASSGGSARDAGRGARGVQAPRRRGLSAASLHPAARSVR